MTLPLGTRLRDAYRERGDECCQRSEKQLSVPQHAEPRPGDLAGRLRQRHGGGGEDPCRSKRARTPQCGAQRGGDSERNERERDKRGWQLSSAPAPRDERETARAKREQRERAHAF